MSNQKARVRAIKFAPPYITLIQFTPPYNLHPHTIYTPYNLHPHQHKDYPVVGKLIITIDFKDGTPSRTINDIELQEKVQGILRELYRDDNIQKITVVGEDKFGNISKNKVKYTEPEQIEVKFIMPRANHWALPEVQAAYDE